MSNTKCLTHQARASSWWKTVTAVEICDKCRWTNQSHDAECLAHQATALIWLRTASDLEMTVKSIVCVNRVTTWKQNACFATEWYAHLARRASNWIGQGKWRLLKFSLMWTPVAVSMWAKVMCNDGNDTFFQRALISQNHLTSCHQSESSDITVEKLRSPGWLASDNYLCGIWHPALCGIWQANPVASVHGQQIQPPECQTHLGVFLNQRTFFEAHLTGPKFATVWHNHWSDMLRALQVIECLAKKFCIFVDALLRFTELSHAPLQVPQEEFVRQPERN